VGAKRSLKSNAVALAEVCKANDERTFARMRGNDVDAPITVILPASPEPANLAHAAYREDAVYSGNKSALLGRQLQAVADPELGQDMGRTGWIRFNLLS
jgi:hypothetical protein